MTTLYEGTRHKLDYACTKLRNIIDDFYLDGEQTERFTPDIDTVVSLQDELDIVENIANLGWCDKTNWELVSKYSTLADEFRLARSIR